MQTLKRCENYPGIFTVNFGRAFHCQAFVQWSVNDQIQGCKIVISYTLTLRPI